MSKYTTEVRYICEVASGKTSSVGGNDVESVIKNALSSVFDFDFPIFDETYRSVLETKILRHYYTREIGFETVGLWKLKLNTRLNEIMPYYNKLYNSELLSINPLYSTDITKEHTGKDDSTRNITDTGSNTRTNDLTKSTNTNGTVSTDTTTTNNGTATGTNGNTTTELYSDTPQGALTNVENQTYLTNATKTTESANSSGTTKNTNVVDGTVSSNETGSIKDTGTITDSIDKSNNDVFTSTDSYIDHITGYENNDVNELLMKYRKTLLNIDMQVIDNLEDLFMQLW